MLSEHNSSSRKTKRKPNQNRKARLFRGVKPWSETTGHVLSKIFFAAHRFGREVMRGDLRGGAHFLEIPALAFPGETDLTTGAFSTVAASLHVRQGSFPSGFRVIRRITFAMSSFSHPREECQKVPVGVV